MKMTELKKALNQLDKSELISLICTAYKNADFVQRQVDILLRKDDAERELLGDFKEYIREAFFDMDLSLRTAKGYISEFKKLCGNKEYHADLMLYYVECGVDFTNEYGDIDERFYNSVILMFSDFAKLLYTLPEKFYSYIKPKIERVHEGAQDIGWGFTDGMNEIYSEIRGNFGDDYE